MYMNKTITWVRQNTVAFVALLGVILVGALMVNAYSGGSATIVVESGGVLNVESLVVESGGGLVGAASFISAGSNFTDVKITNDLDVDGDAEVNGTLQVDGAVNFKESSESLTATNTIAIAESGKTFYLSGGFQQHTLPATSTPGQVYRFVVDGAITGTTTIVTAGGINSINGTLIVNGAVVDCDDEDTIEFVDNLENEGDFVELRTDGTDWFIGASGALTTSALTCSAS